MTLLSINLSSLQPLKVGRRMTRTGHFKQGQAGPVRLGRLGLEGDAVGNLKHHGGPDQAVYVYSAEDYAWWEQQLGRSLPFGTFGENLTVDRLQAARIGDIWQCGPVSLQISAPRIPCATLAARMGDPGFAKRFARANRGGAYARVLEPGTLTIGQSVEVTAGQGPLVDDLFELWHSRDKDPQLLRAGLSAPLAERARAAFLHWLEAEGV
ncbi:MOSC domain-containing protein [bacterium]|nr:MOSC domain-containing protein [bacterium]